MECDICLTGIRLRPALLRDDGSPSPHSQHARARGVDCRRTVDGNFQINLHLIRHLYIDMSQENVDTHISVCLVSLFHPLLLQRHQLYRKDDICKFTRTVAK